MTESFGAGTASAIQQYVASSPDIEHSLLRRLRVGTIDASETMGMGQFAHVWNWREGSIRAVHQVRRIARERDFNVIHAHSSIAGGLVRAALWTSNEKIAYTPHCYAFERLDMPTPTRLTAKWVERVLSKRTDLVIACSERELELATKLGQAAILVPNTADTAAVGQPKEERTSVEKSPVVVAVGRLSQQKDPYFFGEFFTRLRTIMPASGVWIGDGDMEAKEKLRECGVTVTGWVPRTHVVEILEEADLYVHTAAWEGFPISLLEANARRIPVVARDIPALSGRPAAWMAGTTDGLAHLAADVLRCQSKGATNIRDWDSRLEENSPEAQRRRLHQAYRLLAQ